MSDGNQRKQPALKLIALCFALVGLAGGIGYGLHRQSVYEQIADYRIADYAKHSREKINQACASVADSERPMCHKKAKTEYELERRDNERNEYDLIAQRRSALWTAIMGVAALIGMGLSAVGVWLVWTTFRETRSANQIASEALERGSRAWIVFADLVKRRVVNSDGNLLGYYVEAQGRNTGNTPAFNASGIQFCELTADDNPTAILKFLQDKSHKEGFAACNRVVISPGGPSRTGGTRIDLDEISVFGTGPMNFFMYVRAEYTTVGSNHVRHTCFIVKAAFDANLPAIERWEKFEFVPWGHSEMT